MEEKSTIPSENEKAPIGKWIQLAVVIIVPFVALAWLWRDHCSHELVQESQSPDGTKLVQVVQTRCSASKPAVSMRMGKKANGDLEDDAEILLYQGEVHAADKAPIAEPFWSGPNSLSLATPQGASIVKRRTHWLDVKIVVNEI